MKRSLLCAALASFLSAGPPAQAVERHAEPKKPAAVEKPEPEPSPQPSDGAPPYETQLTRLSEVMGALTFMRTLCGYADGIDYRARMAALLDAEAPAQERREKLVGAFNRGYVGYRTTYRACTPNAQLVIARFTDEGARIAREISSRFGGS